MNKEDHFIDTDKLGDVLLEFSKKISRFSQNIPDTLFGSLTEFLKNIPDDVKNTQLFANVQKLSNYDLNYEDVWWLVDSYGLIDKEDAEEELMEYYEQENIIIYVNLFSLSIHKSANAGISRIYGLFLTFQ